LTGLLATLAAWLAAQCLLALWHGVPALPTAPLQTLPTPGLLAAHWNAPVPGAQLPLTTLPVEYVGGLRAVPLSATVVVLRYQQQQRALSLGQRLAPGVTLHAITQQGLVFNNNGRHERLPWPAPRPLTGLKRQG